MIEIDNFDVFFDFFIEKLDIIWNYTLDIYIQLSFMYIFIFFYKIHIYSFIIHDKMMDCGYLNIIYIFREHLTRNQLYYPKPGRQNF